MKSLPCPGSAGIILLHPFLSTLFTYAELLTEGKFSTKAAQAKAVCMLHYLLKGTESEENIAQPLPHILCGLAADEIIAPVPLNSTERNVCDQLLLAVLNRWEKLKNSTPQALRESFLQRDGDLVLGDEWILTVEPRGPIDILLQTLPWSIQVVKTSWMEKAVFVSWV